MRALSRLLVLLLCWLIFAPLPDLAAQTAADLFDRQTLHEIHLLMNSRDLSELRERYEENTYYPADLEWRGVRVRNVAIRARGGGSRSATKPGLRVDFNRYATGRTFLGLTSLVLDNEFQDPSLIHEPVTMAFFRRMGQAAPREAFCRLFLNNLYQGVYAIVEDPEMEFIGESFGDAAGFLFEYKYLTAFYGDDLGNDLAAYKPLFEPRTHKLDADSTLYSPIRELFRPSSEPDDLLWRQQIERYVDLPQFVTQVAIEKFVSELDGIVGYAGMNNFYLYRPSGSTVHRFIPWDRDNAFQAIDSSIFERADENILLRRALGFPDLRGLYLDVLDRCVQAATQDDWLANEISAVAALISDAAHEDIWKAYSNETYDAAIAFLMDFARRRAASVHEQVTRARMP